MPSGNKRRGKCVHVIYLKGGRKWSSKYESMPGKVEVLILRCN